MFTLEDECQYMNACIILAYVRYIRKDVKHHAFDIERQDSVKTF